MLRTLLRFSQKSKSPSKLGAQTLLLFQYTLLKDSTSWWWKKLALHSAFPTVVEKLRAEISLVLKRDCHLKCNISRDEVRALKKTSTGQIQGCAYSGQGGKLVVLAKKDYVNKAQDLLA